MTDEKHILIVEDDPKLLQTLAESFAAGGHGLLHQDDPALLLGLVRKAQVRLHRAISPAITARP